MDIQMTRDGELVVIHDERVDRTTEGIGDVRDYTLTEIKRLHIYAGEKCSQKIPALNEVFDMLSGQMKEGLKLNIELKNSVCPYEGMEEKIVEEVHRRGLQKAVIYSTFYAKSLEKLKTLDPEAELGILDGRASDCIYKIKGGCGAVAIHPFWREIDLTPEQMKGYVVRAWMGGHLYPEKPTGNRLNMETLQKLGIMSVFLNEPEMYLDN